MPEINLNNFKKILIVRFSSLGDVLLTTPMLRALKKQNPNLAIDFLIREEYADILRFNPNIKELLTFSRTEDTYEIIQKIAPKDYDLVIDLQNNFRSRRLTKNLRKKTIRFCKPSLKKFMLVHFKINLLKERKQIPIRYAETIPNFFLDEEGLDLFLPDEGRNEEFEHKKVIGICPGSKHFTKQWPKEYFVELGNLLKGNGFEIILFGGSDDIDICEQICEKIPGALNYSNNNKLFKTAAEMKRCSLIVCNDSGLMHTATALKIPVISIFGSTVLEFGFAPYKSENLILENNLLSCRPCSHIGRNTCPKDHFKCMKELTAGYVYEQFLTYYKSL